MNDVTEVKTIIDSLRFIEGEMPKAITGWKQHIKSCNWAIENKVIKRVCESPASYHQEIFAPLYSFLNTYLANREGRVAFTSKQLDNFLIQGLRAIKNYTDLTDFFARNPQYFSPDIDPTLNYKGSQEARVSQKKYKDFIFTVNERLIGCKDQLDFMFLKLLSTVKNLNPEMAEMKAKLENQCTLMRVQRLRM